MIEPVAPDDANIFKTALVVAPVPILAVFVDTSTEKADARVEPPTAISSAVSVRYVIPAPSVQGFVPPGQVVKEGAAPLADIKQSDPAPPVAVYAIVPLPSVE